jgi:hypothetical protein
MALKPRPAPQQGATLEERAGAADGVPQALADAMRAVLADADLDGAFVAAAITLPSDSELIDGIPGVDPLVLHGVRCARRRGAPAVNPECRRPDTSLVLVPLALTHLAPSNFCMTGCAAPCGLTETPGAAGKLCCGRVYAVCSSTARPMQATAMFRILAPLSPGLACLGGRAGHRAQAVCGAAADGAAAPRAGGGRQAQ